jgi:hypothetical protein
MKTEQEYIEELESLVTAFTDLAKFHELATVDSRAVELLLHADALEGIPDGESEDSKAWLEELRVANSHELT